MSNIPQTSVAAAMDIGIPGQLADLQSNSDASVDTATSEEASANIPFGVFVQQGSADDGALVVTGTTNVLKGIVVHGHSFERLTELFSDGLGPKTTFGVLVKGRVFVICNTDSTGPTDEVHVQVVAETNKPVGSIGKAASSGKSIDITPLARWKRSSTAHGDLNVLEIDMTNAALASAD